VSGVRRSCATSLEHLPKVVEQRGNAIQHVVDGTESVSIHRRCRARDAIGEFSRDDRWQVRVIASMRRMNCTLKKILRARENYGHSSIHANAWIIRTRVARI